MLIERIESLQRSVVAAGGTPAVPLPTGGVPASKPAAVAPVKVAAPELVRADADMQANLAVLLACLRRQKDQQIERCEVLDIVLDS